MIGFVVGLNDAVAPELLPSVWRMTAALLVVLGLLAGLAWMLKRFAASRKGRGVLSIEAALALGERRSLAIVTIEGRRLLLGLAPNHVSLVAELAPPAAPASFEATVVQAVNREPQS